MQDNSKTDPQRIEILLSEAKGLLKNGAKLNVLDPGQKRAVGNPRLRGITDIATAINYANKGYNLGFSPGNRLVVVDVDCKNGQPGLDTINQMDLPPTHTVTTPSGGMHCYFGRPTWMTEQHTHLDTYPGIEFFSGNHNIVMAGSMVDGTPYRVAIDRPPVMLPDWLARDLDASGDCGDFGGEPEGGNDLEELRRLLKKIPNTGLDYHAWLSVGMALHFETHGSSEGYDLWVAWSTQSRKHSEKEMPKKWRSFSDDASRGRKKTIGTLRRMAAAAASGAFEDLGDDPYEPGDVGGEEPEQEEELFKDLIRVGPETCQEIPLARDWIVDNFACRGYLNGVTGRGGSAKSTISLTLAASVALGTDLLNVGRVNRGKVLFISNEEDAQEFHRRRAAMMMQYGIDANNLDGWLHYLPKGKEPHTIATAIYSDGVNKILPSASWQKIMKLMQKERYDLILIDPFSSMLTNIEENSNVDMNAVMQILGTTALLFDVAITVLHHTSKSGNSDDPDSASRGASAIVNALRNLLHCHQMTAQDVANTMVPPEEASFYIRMTGGKSNLGERRGHSYARIEPVTIFAQDKDGEPAHETVATVVPAADSLFDPNTVDAGPAILRFVAEYMAEKGEVLVRKTEVQQAIFDSDVLPYKSKNPLIKPFNDAIPYGKGNYVHLAGWHYWQEVKPTGCRNSDGIFREKAG